MILHKLLYELMSEQMDAHTDARAAKAQTDHLAAAIFPNRRFLFAIVADSVLQKIKSKILISCA